MRSLLEIRLSQLALAYTIENNLPTEAIQVHTRVKSLSSFLRKLDSKGWPQFYYATEIVGDLVGARVICWFLDDCNGFIRLISSSNHLRIASIVEDYISNPKKSGYRSIHLVANIAFDRVHRDKNDVVIIPAKMPCELQIRTKLQDAWGDLTHEFHYKAKHAGVDDADLEDFLSDIAARLANEDKTLMKFRNVYQRLAEEKLKSKTRESLKPPSTK